MQLHHQLPVAMSRKNCVGSKMLLRSCVVAPVGPSLQFVTPGHQFLWLALGVPTYVIQAPSHLLSQMWFQQQQRMCSSILVYNVDMLSGVFHSIWKCLHKTVVTNTSKNTSTCLLILKVLSTLTLTTCGFLCQPIVESTWLWTGMWVPTVEPISMPLDTTSHTVRVAEFANFNSSKVVNEILYKHIHSWNICICYISNFL